MSCNKMHCLDNMRTISAFIQMLMEVVVMFVNSLYTMNCKNGATFFLQ